MVGTVKEEGRVLEGTWTQTNLPNGGPFHFEMLPVGRSWKGRYSYADRDAWNGRRGQ